MPKKVHIADPFILVMALCACSVRLDTWISIGHLEFLNKLCFEVILRVILLESILCAMPPHLGGKFSLTALYYTKRYTCKSFITSTISELWD